MISCYNKGLDFYSPTLLFLGGAPTALARRISV
nr:MAG TPA: hypothetical protein [Caudoviricetes sp.]